MNTEEGHELQQADSARKQKGTRRILRMPCTTSILFSREQYIYEIDFLSKQSSGIDYAPRNRGPSVCLIEKGEYAIKKLNAISSSPP